nr:MAG TPA: hypothetical protein [Microviridae sp.]
MNLLYIPDALQLKLRCACFHWRACIHNMLLWRFGFSLLPP